MKLSVLTTLYRSAPYLPEFYRRTSASARQLTEDYELVFVNDGSPDEAARVVLTLQETDPRVVLIDLTRNFGHHPAIMTGLRHCAGDYVFLIDCDLEESPEMLPRFWDALSQDADLDVVFGVQPSRKGGWWERATGDLFYRLFYFISNIHYPRDTLTARLMSRRYVQKLGEFGEKALDIWGVFVLAGYRQTSIPLEKGDKGSTSYSFVRKARLAIDSITSYSNKPMYFILMGGLALTLGGGVGLVGALPDVARHDPRAASAVLLASVWFIGGLVLTSLGTIGIYLSKVLVEVKNRPLTLIKAIHRRHPYPELTTR